MKNKLIKSLALVLTGTMILSSMPVNVFAEEDEDDGVIEYQDSDDDDFNNNTGVNAEIGSTYKVTIPKVIVLSGTTKQAAYYVKVDGDVAGTEVVKVVPDETFNLYSINKDAQEASVTQDKTEWRVADLVAKTEANGQVSASEITAGSWSGTFNFNIDLESVNGEVDEPTPIHTHTPGEPVHENEIAATTEAAGSYDEVVYCLECGEEISRNTVTIPKLEPEVTLPEAGTSITDMSFAQIQKIAQEGKTADYGIKVGDQIAVNDTVNAEIIEIGEDYIEFATTSKVVDSADYPDSISVGGYNADYNAISSFYAGPQVNNGITNTATVGYYNSNIRNQVNAWFNAQSDEFKAAVKDTTKTYETATLTFNDSKYLQTKANGTVEVSEKVYIPSKADLEGKMKNTVVFKNTYFWTSSPCAITGHAYAGNSFGCFCYCCCDNYSFFAGYGNHGACALFRIG